MKLSLKRISARTRKSVPAWNRWHELVRRLSLSLLPVTLLLPALANQADLADWPHFLGPHRDGVYHGPPLRDRWKRDDVEVIWSRQVGRGFSAPVVAQGNLILFHRFADREVVECLDALTGDRRWRFAYPTSYKDDFGFDNGPRATPAISGPRVYTLGAGGKLHCLDLNTGKKIWSIHTRHRFQAPKGFFGAAASPLVEGNRVLLNVGGQDTSGVVAFDRENGEVVWTATSDRASYSSPTLATIEGQKQALFFTRNGLISVNPATGSVGFKFRWRSRMRASVNAATPLVVDNLVFLSASYRTGAILLRLTGTEPTKVWSGDDSLSNHYATSVYWQDHVYGFHGRQEYGPSFRCIELRTGKVRWSQNRFGAGTVVRTGNRLLLLTEKGELSLVSTETDDYRKLAGLPILTGTVRAYPAIARGHFYARNHDTLVCVVLPEKSKQTSQHSTGVKKR